MTSSITIRCFEIGWAFTQLWHCRLCSKCLSSCLLSMGATDRGDRLLSCTATCQGYHFIPPHSAMYSCYVYIICSSSSSSNNIYTKLASNLRALLSLWFDVGALKAVFLSSFSGITTSVLQVSAACAFITRDQKLSSSGQLSAPTRHRTHRTRTT